MNLILGILLALACALATNVGFLFKHRGACQVPAVDYLHPLRSAKALFSCKTFAFGFAIATGAWGFHVAAMSMAPLTIVQSVLAGGVVAARDHGRADVRPGHVAPPVGRDRAHRRRPADARLQPADDPRRALPLLDARPRAVRGNLHHRRARADVEQAARHRRPPPRLHARRLRGPDVRRLRCRDQGGLGRDRRPRAARPVLAAARDCRLLLGRRLLRLRQGPAGRRRRPGDRGHRHRRQRRWDRRRASSCSATRSPATR